MDSRNTKREMYHAKCAFSMKSSRHIMMANKNCNLISIDTTVKKNGLNKPFLIVFWILNKNPISKLCHHNFKKYALKMQEKTTFMNFIIFQLQYVTCWRSFIAIKVMYVVRTFSSQKEFLVSVMINKISMVKCGMYCRS